jgi:hypothetical protein
MRRASGIRIDSRIDKRFKHGGAVINKVYRAGLNPRTIEHLRQVRGKWTGRPSGRCDRREGSCAEVHPND